MKKLLSLLTAVFLLTFNTNAHHSYSGEPVFRLLSFTCNPLSENNGLNWKTTEEMNVASFIIEKSVDAVTFSTLASISAKNMRGVQQYRFIDDNVMDGTASFYRLKITDKEGAFSYSSIVALTARNNSPSPFNITVKKNVLSLQSINAEKEIIFMNILDAEGKLVFKKQVNTIEWMDNNVTIPVDFLPSGLYSCQVLNKDKEITSLIRFRK